MGATQPSAQWLERANHLALVARLLSGTVHDVNNLLQVISGNAELLESALGDNDVQRKRVRLILANAHRASDLLAEVLAFARDALDRSGRIDLNDVAVQALALRQHSIGKARIDAAIDRKGETVVGLANERAVLHIVLNLIVNAEQALAGRKNARLRIGFAHRSDRVELTVADNGPGMPDEVHARLFKPSVEPIADRLGIGLAVSDWLARAQRGMLAHAVPPGGGCAMTLSLPSGMEAHRAVHVGSGA